jgi:hypothetical protein
MTRRENSAGAGSCEASASMPALRSWFPDPVLCSRRRGMIYEHIAKV